MVTRFVLSDGERSGLERLARSVSAPWCRVRPARALLALADGGSVRGVAREMGAHQDTVRRWRDEFPARGVERLGVVAPGRGRKRRIPEEVEEAIVADTLTEQPPDGSVCWSTRTMAARHGVGKNYVAQVWRERGLRPWRTDVFKLSTDPHFEEKLRDVIGLYANPPERAAVFSFDEKTQIQALDRTQPSLPIRPGRNRTMTHDYKRNGTVDLFAALNVATGEVLTRTRKRHTGADVLAFFKEIDRSTPGDLGIHVILDNLSAHKSQPVREWLAHPRRERWRLHFTPTSSSWANLVEGWFSILTRKALKNRAFTSVAELENVICDWASHWNHNPQPLRWTKPAEEIIAKTKRAQNTLNKTRTHH